MLPNIVLMWWSSNIKLFRCYFLSVILLLLWSVIQKMALPSEAYTVCSTGSQMLLSTAVFDAHHVTGISKMPVSWCKWIAPSPTAPLGFSSGALTLPYDANSQLLSITSSTLWLLYLRLHIHQWLHSHQWLFTMPSLSYSPCPLHAFKTSTT